MVAEPAAGAGGGGFGARCPLDSRGRRRGERPMSGNLLHWIDAIIGLRVAVLGEAMLDAYHDGAVHRFCQEAPVPVVALGERKYIPGGAANTAVNVHALGGRAHFISVVGHDAEAEALRSALV